MSTVHLFAYEEDHHQRLLRRHCHYCIRPASKCQYGPAEQLQTKLEKGRFVYETLVATAERTQKDLRAALDHAGVRYQAFDIANKVLVYGGDRALLTQLAVRPDVARITANHQFQLDEPAMEPGLPVSPVVVEPNVAFVNTDKVWNLGYTGQGTVLARTSPVWSACPALRGQVQLTQQIIKHTAVPLIGQGGSGCGDYVAGPNNDWGYGTIDALAAAQEALARCGAFAHLDGHIYDLATGLPIAAARVVAERDMGGQRALETDAGGYYTLITPAGTFAVTAEAFGYYPATVTGVGVISGAVTTQDISLTAMTAYLVSGTVVDAGAGAPLSATVAIVGSPYPPAQTGPGTGFYALPVPSGTHTLRVESWGSYWQERAIVADHDQTQDFSLAPMPFVPDRGNPLLEPGPPGAWDDGCLLGPRVVQSGWLVENIYRHGRKFTPAQLVERASGQPLHIEPYIRYLRAKFGELYGL